MSKNPTSGMPESAAEIQPGVQTPENMGVFIYPQNVIENAGNLSTVETKAFKASRQIGGMEVRSVMYRPKDTSDIKDSVPLLVCPGYFGNLKDYIDFCQAVASLGKPALTPQLPRLKDLPHTFDPEDIADPQKLPSQAAWGTVAGFSESEDKTEVSFDKIDLKGHSRGGITASLFSKRHPDLVETLNLDSSAGLEDHDLKLLASRLGSFAKNDLVPGMLNGELSRMLNIKGILNTLGYIALNPPRTLMEAVDIAQSDTRAVLRDVRDHGIPIGFNLYEHDDLISAEKTIEHSGDLADLLSIHDDKNLRHLAMQRHPKAMAAYYIGVQLPELRARSKSIKNQQSDRESTKQKMSKPLGGIGKIAVLPVATLRASKQRAHRKVAA